MGVAKMGGIRTLGYIGWKSLAWTIVMSTIGVLIGLILVNVLRPGAGVDQALAQQLLAENAQRSQAIVANIDKQSSGMTMLLGIVPSNVLATASDNGNILSLMLFALVLGIGMILSPADKVTTLHKSIEGLFEISMTLNNLVIHLAPIRGLLYV